VVVGTGQTEGPRNGAAVSPGACMTIEASRLILRHSTLSDVPRLFEFLGNAEAPLRRKGDQKSSGALSTTSFITKNVRVCRTPGSAISWSPWMRLKSAMSPTRIFRK
jgi:hypothetical protein